MNSLNIQAMRSRSNVATSNAKIASWIALIILIVITLFPFWWMVRTALTTPKAIFRDTAFLFPVDLTYNNLERVLGLVDPSKLVGQNAPGVSAVSLNYWTYLRNTLIFSLTITFGQTFFCALSGYAFARLRFPFRRQLFAIYLMGLLVPSIVLFMPNYVLMRQLGLINTFPGMVAPTFFMTPFAVFFMRQFFLNLNKELEESARLDGCTVWGVFWRISLPLISSPMLTLAILTFIGSWNDYLWPLLVGRDDNVRVLTVALGIFRSSGQGLTDWTGLMAGALVSIIPILLLFLILGRKVVDSIQFSGFK
jgi:multiple sugar transport system permease protein